MNRETAQRLYDSHKAEAGELEFTVEEMLGFANSHKLGDEYVMAMKNNDDVIVKIAYYPINCTYEAKLNKKREAIEEPKLKYFTDLRALVEYVHPRWGQTFSEVPIHFLTKNTSTHKHRGQVKKSVAKDILDNLDK